MPTAMFTEMLKELPTNDMAETQMPIWCVIYWSRELWNKN